MSVWNDMRKRSIGDAAKKEDEGVFLSPDTISEKELNDMLNAGVVRFVYKKIKPTKDNPEARREAIGTKAIGIVKKIPHGGECPPKRYGHIPYFDLEQGDWRCFLYDRLIGAYSKVYTEEEIDIEFVKKHITKKAAERAEEKARKAAEKEAKAKEKMKSPEEETI